MTLGTKANMIPHPKPRNFVYEAAFYDDGESAMIYGRYKDSPSFSLGLRWTTAAESDLGYPNIFGKGMWMVVPPHLALYILKGIADDAKRECYILDKDIFAAALKDLEAQNEKSC